MDHSAEPQGSRVLGQERGKHPSTSTQLTIPGQNSGPSKVFYFAIKGVK